MSLKEKYTTFIKQEAIRLGFLSCGISKAGFLEQEAPRLENWLNQNRHGKMAYMENHFDKRLDPTLLVDDAKSVISLLLNYYPAVELSKKQEKDSYKVSKYAYGQDYHFVIKEKLNALLSGIQSEIGEVSGRAFVDSAPVLDKAWAAKSGLGWIGKNANLITQKVGSFYFVAELIVDLELEYDVATTDHCGTCTACPTEAIVAPYVVDGSKCISYFTIELKDNLPNEMKGKFQDWAFGCDVCQDVCPWNRFAKPHNEPLFQPNESLLNFTKKDWEEITKETFNKVFQKSAIKRTKYEGFQRNIAFLKD